MQLTFSDAEGLGKRKQTRREVFLAEMEQVVPWKQLLGLIEPHHTVSGRPGRQLYALATMLRIHLLQQWYALSDPKMEEALHERFGPCHADVGRIQRASGAQEPAPAVRHDRRCEPHRRARLDQECRSRATLEMHQTKEGQSVIFRYEGT